MPSTSLGHDIARSLATALPPVPPVPDRIAGVASPLANRSCVPCRKGTTPLSEAEARRLATEVPAWSLTGGPRLERRFEFEDFAAAMRFVNRVAEVAEAEQHHPDIAIHWNKVELTLWTHSIGGLHENDFVMAAKIDELLEEPNAGATNLAG
jgi:4a-hydroxytetrahydrobiopterin dehydratase